MSGSYASRLSEYPNKGICGLPERFDKERSLTLKLKKLVELIEQSSYTVVLTGAGVSTSAGIRDFRGPNGVWTQEQEETKTANKKTVNGKTDDTNTRKRKRVPPKDFHEATPTVTHKALVKLVQGGHVNFVVTQNVDGLHRRSGLTRDYHSVLHGCVFTEVCSQCRMEHFRDYDVGGMSFNKTGRICEFCGSDLIDTLLDWEDALPEWDWERAQDQCRKADLVIALGTSLRIEPAGSLPAMGKQFVIVNLQETPYDNKAKLIVRAPVDDALEKVMEGLGYMKDWSASVEEAKIERHWQQPPAEDSDDEE